MIDHLVSYRSSQPTRRVRTKRPKMPRERVRSELGCLLKQASTQAPLEAHDSRTVIKSKQAVAVFLFTAMSTATEERSGKSLAALPGTDVTNGTE